MRLAKIYLLLAFALGAPSITWARSDLNTRLDRLENIVENEYNNKLLEQLDAMQQEILELRGKLEEQQNAMQSLNQKQDKFFTNLDSRLNTIEPGVKEAQEATAAATETKAEAVVSEEASAAVPVIEATPIAQPKSEAPKPSAELQLPGTSENSLYEAVTSHIHKKEYSQAILEIKDMLWQFPEGVHACAGYYWLGELYKMQWHANKSDKDLLTNAKEAFNTVVNKYQGFEYEGDAMLKLALLEMDQEHLAVAKDMLEQVVAKFPNSARARIAETNIVRIEDARIKN